MRAGATSTALYLSHLDEIGRVQIRIRYGQAAGAPSNPLPLVPGEVWKPLNHSTRLLGRLRSRRRSHG